MKKFFKKDWIVVSGVLKKINYKGLNDFRFPEELARLVISEFSSKGNWVLDPFAGFGTTIHVAHKLGRRAIGFEAHKGRSDFANKGLKSPNKVIHDSVRNVRKYGLPKFDLVFTSPPYVTVRLEDDPHGKTYFKDLLALFREVKKTLKPKAKVVVEVSNIRDKKYGVRPLAWQVGELLSKEFIFEGEIIRCNRSRIPAGPGFYHSYLLVYRNK